MKVTASQIRQDFNNFGGFGQQGYGYNTNYLYEEIGKILKSGDKHIKESGLYTDSVDEHGFIYKGTLYCIEEDDIVSIQLANNEVGTIQDIKSISEIQTERIQFYLCFRCEPAAFRTDGRRDTDPPAQ